MKDLKIVGFYKSLLEIVGVNIHDDGSLYIPFNNNKETPLMIDGLPGYLPTRNAIDTMFDYSRGGEPLKVKELFNPLDEHAIAGGNVSFNKFKSMLELKLLSAIYYIGEELLIMSSSDTEINDFTISKFTSLLSNYQGGAKKLIDQKTAESWLKVYESILAKHINKKYVSLISKKGGIINEIKYNRIGVITFPLGESILELTTKNNLLLDVKLRKKDIEVFISIIKFIFGNEDTIKDGIQVGSLNKVSPSTHSLLLMYNKIYEKVNPIVTALKDIGVEDDVSEAITLKPLPYDVSVISEIVDNFENDVRQIPNALSVVTKDRQVTEVLNPVPVSVSSDYVNPKYNIGNKKQENAIKYNNPVAQPIQQPVQQQHYNQQQLHPVQQQQQYSQQHVAPVQQSTSFNQFKQSVQQPVQQYNQQQLVPVQQVQQGHNMMQQPVVVNRHIAQPVQQSKGRYVI